MKQIKDKDYNDLQDEFNVYEALVFKGKNREANCQLDRLLFTLEDFFKKYNKRPIQK